MRQTSEEFIGSIGESFVSQAEKNFQFLEDLARIYAPSISMRDNMPNSSNIVPEKIKPLLLTVKGIHDISTIYAGYEDGLFVGALNADDKTMLKSGGVLVPKETNYRFKINNKGYEKWIYADAKDNIILREDLIKSPYDPRSRPWYKLTQTKKDVAWSDVYVFTGAFKEPGITVSAPIRAANGDMEGVFGVDITLSLLKKSLQKIRITENSRFYIVNDKDEIIISSGSKSTIRQEGASFRLLKISELEDSHILRHALEIDKTEAKPKQLNFSFNGEDFSLKKIKFNSPNFNSWSLVVTYPQKDVIGKLQQASLQALLISALIFAFAVIMMYFLSQRFSKPIMMLALEAEKIRDLQLDSEIHVTSNLKEISSLASAMESMKASLRSFTLYMPRELVKALLLEGKEIKIGGVEKEITIFFSDIEGFTTISEKLPPQVLADQLSEYFSIMGNSIAIHNGTIDKFIGDAVMAFWGAPKPDETHIEDACKSALMAQALLKIFNDNLISQGLSPLYTRIGVHTGMTIVGNIGSPERMNYTVLGDSVNLASRLEALNKYYGSRVLISQSVKEQLSLNFIARPLDIVAVKGKKNGTKIWELMGCIGNDALGSIEGLAELADVSEKAFDLYASKKWQEAVDAFEKIEIAYPKDEATKVLLERCRKFVITPPAEDWDGCYQMDRK